MSSVVPTDGAEPKLNENRHVYHMTGPSPSEMKTDMCTTCAAPFLCTRAFRFLLVPACRPRARLALHSQIGRKPYQEFSLNALVFAILCGVGPTGVAEPSVKENVSHAQPLSYARAPEASNACFCWP